MDPWDPWDPRNSVKEAEMKLSKGEVLGFREIQRVARSYLYILDHTCTISFVLGMSNQVASAVATT